METRPNTTANTPSITPQPEETIFSDIVDTAPYEKSLKTARIWLYVIAALQAIVGIYEYNSVSDPTAALVSLLIDGGIGVVFLLLAVWSYQKPVAAFMTALITYVVIHIGMMFIDPSNIYKGIILKVLIVVALVKACKDAREVQKLKEASIRS
jgi:hypothetical protein